MKRFAEASVVAGFILIFSIVASAQCPSTLNKIKDSGVLTIGVRPDAPPFSFMNKQKERSGFSIELAELVHKALEKKLGQTIKLEMKETTPATRITLVTSGSIDLITETMTDTRERRKSVDFSLIYFVTGADFIVKKGSAIRGTKDIAGKRIGAQLGSTNERILREKYPQAQLVTFPDQPAAFLGLQRGELDAYCNDAIQLWGLKVKSTSPDEWEVVGDWISYEPYAMAMRKNDSDFRAVVNKALMEAIEGGEYFRLYQKWFGPQSDVPYPMGQAFKTFLLFQVVPK
jgi:ABC-type amino acid transport substrate-binding protein